MRTTRALVLFVWALLLATALPATSIGAQELAQTYDGSWSGTTSQSQPISFTVAGNAITNVVVKYKIGICTITSTITTNTAISGSSFALTVGSLAINGSFSSATTATGTGAFSSTNPACSGSVNVTWNATRGGVQTYSISGTVRDPYGAPAAGVYVAAFPRETGGSIVVQTAADGTYTLTLSAGTYDLQAAKDGYYADHVFGLSIPPSLTGIDMDLGVLNPPATISGTVRDSGGTPLAGAQVSATPSGGGSPVTTQTAADGTYTLSVSAGTYTLQAAKQGYQAGASVSATVPPSRTGADLVLTAQSTGGGSGRLYLPLVKLTKEAPVAPDPGQGGTLSLVIARESNQLTCHNGFPWTTYTPKAGFTFLIVEATVRRQQAGTFAVASDDFALTAPDGSQQRPNGSADNTSTGCLNTSFVVSSPNETMEIGLAFVVRKELIGQEFSLTLKNGEPLRFMVERL